MYDRIRFYAGSNLSQYSLDIAGNPVDSIPNQENWESAAVIIKYIC